MDPMYSNRLCRFCLCSSECLINLFEQNGEHGFIIEDAIEDLLRFKVSKTDGYPPFICPICFGKLNSFRIFKCLCNNSRVAYANKYFRKGNYGGNEIHPVAMSYQTIKEEPDDVITDYVPCEVSIKTEQDDGETSVGTMVCKDVRQMSDENFSEVNDVENNSDSHVMTDNPSETEYFNEGTTVDSADMKIEGPQKRKSWDKESMMLAVEAVINKEMSLLKASKTFNVPRSTIKDYVKKNGKNRVDASIGRKPVLPIEVEEELVYYCLEMEQKYFGLTPKDVEHMAYHLASRNGLKHPFSDEKQAAGRKWVKQFFRRHPNLVYRRPQTPTAARIAGFTGPNVEKFFSSLEPELVRINFSPERVFCVDETGIVVVQENTVKVLGLKGRSQIASLSPSEKGTLVTIFTCMSASGQFIPPMMVLPCCESEKDVLTGCPGGTVVCYDTTSSWIQPETFIEWLVHFVSVVKPTPYNPVVLVVDAHYSHNRNIDVIEFGRAYGVAFVCLPPHSTHKMHPVDVAFMGPFKTLCMQEVEHLRNTSNGLESPLTHHQVAGIMGKAYEKLASVEVAANGFWKTGISPFQKNAFGDHDFTSYSRDLEVKLGVDTVGQSNVTSGCPQPSTSGQKHPPTASVTSI